MNVTVRLTNLGQESEECSVCFYGCTGLPILVRGTLSEKVLIVQHGQNQLVKSF